MNPVEKYFNSERFFCAIGIGIGLVAIAFAGWFLFKTKQPFYTGMAYPFLVLGFFFLVICTGVYLRSPKDTVRVSEYVQTNSDQLKTDELPRMNTVMQNFKVIMIVEISLIVLSIVIIAFTSVSSTWKGASTGVLILATLLLGFDWLANKRGAEYHEYLIQTVAKRSK